MRRWACWPAGETRLETGSLTVNGAAAVMHACMHSWCAHRRLHSLARCTPQGSAMRDTWQAVVWVQGRALASRQQAAGSRPLLTRCALCCAVLCGAGWAWRGPTPASPPRRLATCWPPTTCCRAWSGRSRMAATARYLMSWNGSGGGGGGGGGELAACHPPHRAGHVPGLRLSGILSHPVCIHAGPACPPGLPGCRCATATRACR